MVTCRREIKQQPQQQWAPQGHISGTNNIVVIVIALVHPWFHFMRSRHIYVYNATSQCRQDVYGDGARVRCGRAAVAAEFFVAGVVAGRRLRPLRE